MNFNRKHVMLKILCCLGVTAAVMMAVLTIPLYIEMSTAVSGLFGIAVGGVWCVVCSLILRIGD